MPTTVARNTRLGLLAGRSPLLRFQSDERLIALIRSGHEGAFELLFERYRPRLLAFCRHMLASKEDAEDVLQEVFAASFNAIRADDRELNVRPWLYRIARNRCLNHLRRPQPDGRDTMDDQIAGHGVTTADLVHRRVDLHHLFEDIQRLPESQRTALLLREIDVLSYEQISETMETTVPSVKSLLVRARMSLAEAAEARQLSCGDVRHELAEVAEGLRKTSAPVRRHLRTCKQCGRYRTQLRKTSTAMAIAFPIGPFMLLKKLALAKLGAAAAAGGGGAATGGAGAGGLAAGGAATTGAGAAAGGLAASGAGAAVPFGIGAVATKAITVTAATALLAGGAVEVQKIARPEQPAARTAAAVAVKRPAVQSGGQSASALPPVAVVKEKLLKDEAASAGEPAKPPAKESAETPTADQAAPAEADQPVPAGTTGPAQGVTDPQPVEGQAEPAPADTPTGGAALPPPGPAQQPGDGQTTRP
jgi:RNA polymerase sigma factor (sigma-70 family)